MDRWDPSAITFSTFIYEILPRHLLRELAKTLYEQRARLAGLQTLGAADIGRTLAGNADHVSKRFKQFLEQEELVGRIVLALIEKDPSKGGDGFYAAVLTLNEL